MTAWYRVKKTVQPEEDSFNIVKNQTIYVKITGRKANEIIMESLILAQNERWRRVLSMQVERD